VSVTKPTPHSYAGVIRLGQTRFSAALSLAAFLATTMGLSVPTLAATGTHGGNTHPSETIKATGVVFEDRDGDGLRDQEEPGLSGVRVSNGETIVTTDDQGRYEIEIDAKDATVFVIKPRDFMTPTDADGLPRFTYSHKPEGSPPTQYAGIAPTGPLPASVDFPLVRRPEPNRFRVVMFGDTQPRDLKEVDFIAHDVVAPLAAAEAQADPEDRAAFGVTLGDVVNDDLDVMPPLNAVVGRLGLPWYNVLGNHDMNYDSPDDSLSDETFERIYGAPYYAFNYGPVHFVVLDDVIWSGIGPDRPRGRYKGGLGERQLTFLRHDLAGVPKETLVVFLMHIPVWEMEDREAFYRLIEDRPHTLSFSAHTHIQEYRLLGPEEGWTSPHPHLHVNHVTVCGSWWTGKTDENGIPHTTMRDGVPNGYSIVHFDGPNYVIDFKPARRPASHQMTIFAPDFVTVADAARTEVLANIFTGLKTTPVQVRIDGGDWINLTRSAEPDPYYVRLKQAETGPNPPDGRPLPNPAASPHLWKGTLPADLSVGAHTIEVRFVDHFNRTFTDRRIIRVVPNPADADAQTDEQGQNGR